MTLLWILLIPFIGGLLCWQMERLGGQFVRWIALLSMSLSLLLACAIWLSGDFSLAATGLDNTGSSAAAPWIAEWRQPWIPRFGISLHLAVDGLSLLMVILTCFIGVLAVLCSWKEIVQRIGFFHLNLLWILGGV
ncbi:MAG: NADH-quinone oxidoreductase subunit M, partial [Aeromonas hydrophila]